MPMIISVLNGFSVGDRLTKRATDSGLVASEKQQTIDEMLDEARAGHYARVRAFFHSIDDVDLDTPDRHHLRSVEILGSYHAAGRSIESLKCLDRISIIALRRNGVSSSDPLPEVELMAGDVLVIQGPPEDIQAAEIEIMAGL